MHERREETLNALKLPGGCIDTTPLKGIDKKP
jgi:hypothetical protein